MWEPYLCAELPAPTEEDRARLEAVAGGPLPPGYWELAAAHQGKGLIEELVEDPAFASLILLLVVSPERLGKAEISYSVAATLKDVMPRYPAGLLPFADDTGRNLRAFDNRALAGEEGVTTVAPDFASLLARIGRVSG